MPTEADGAVRVYYSRGDARRWVWAQLVLDERLSPRDPLAPEGDAEVASRMLRVVAGPRAGAEAVLAVIAGAGSHDSSGQP